LKVHQTFRVRRRLLPSRDADAFTG